MDLTSESSSGWTAKVGQSYLPQHLQRASTRPFYDAEQLRAMSHGALLLLSTGLLWLAGIVVQAVTSGLLVEAPPVTSWWPAPLLAGFGVIYLAEKGVLPDFCRRLALGSWVAVAGAAVIYAGAGIYARAHIAPGPEIRSQIANIEHSGRKFSRSTTTTLALQDGTIVRTRAYPGREYGSMGRCLAVQRLAGPFGFAWLRITDAAPLPPAPGPGQLAWPVEPVSRDDCFSGKPLSTLRGTT